MEKLCAGEGIVGELALLAHAGALLHDTGRFEQYTTFRTFHDERSFDHAARGVAILRREGIIEALTKEEQDTLLTAVVLHSRRKEELPAIDERYRLLTGLVRDADKLDILYLAMQTYQQEDDAKTPHLIGIEQGDAYSPEVLEEILAGKSVTYQHVRTATDRKLLFLSWAHDLNTATAVRLVTQEGYFSTLIDLLPAHPDREKIREAILETLERKSLSTEKTIET
jgi:hypothetical protein